MGLVAKHPPENRQPSDAMISKGIVVCAIAGGIVGAWLAAANDFGPLGVILCSAGVAGLFGGVALWTNRW